VNINNRFDFVLGQGLKPKHGGLEEGGILNPRTRDNQLPIYGSMKTTTKMTAPKSSAEPVVSVEVEPPSFYKRFVEFIKDFLFDNNPIPKKKKLVGGVIKEVWDEYIQSMNPMLMNGILSGKDLSETQTLYNITPGNFGSCKYDPDYRGLTNGNGITNNDGKYLTPIIGGLLKSHE